MSIFSSRFAEHSKQVRFSIKDRLEILERLESGENPIDLAQEYKISTAAVLFIKKSKEHLLKERNSIICQKQTLKKRCTKNNSLDQSLHEWFLQRKNINKENPVTNAMLQEKALDSNKTLKVKNNFKDTDINRFKRKRDIGFPIISIDQNTSSFCQKLIKYVMDNKILLDNVYNVKITELYWKTLPSKTLVTGNESLKYNLDQKGSIQDFERKLVKNKVTLMVCTNATGSHKLPMFVMGEANNLHCFEDIRYLPVIYMKQKNALMDKQLVLTWYQKVFLPEIERVHGFSNKQCLLLLGSAPNQPSEEEFNSISEGCRVIYLPSNMISHIQPMDQGIIEKLKKIYKKSFLRIILTAETLEDVQRLLKSFDMLKFCHLISDAWNEVTDIIIKNSWKNIFPSHLEPEIDARSFLNMVNKIPGYNNTTLQEINSWLNSDNNEQECQTLNDQKLSFPEYKQENSID